MKKKILLGILIALAVMCLFAITAFAVEVDGVHYSLDSNNKVAKVSTDNRTATTVDVVIPATFEYDGVTYQVTSIANDAFSGNDTVASIRIESPYITKIPSSFILNTYDGALRSIYIDFTKITRIESAGLNAGAGSNGNSPKANEIYYYDLNGNKITKFDFPNIEYIGFAAFQGINFEEIVIHENTQLGLSGEYSQCFRMSTAKTFILKGERTAINNYQFESMTKLEKIVIESTSLTLVGGNAFSGCTALKEIHIDLSGVETVGGAAFRFSGLKGVEQNLAQWYNLDGKKIVDLSSVKSFTGTQAFNGSNLGSAQVIWPTNYTASNFGHSTDSGAFRSAGLKGTVYFDAAEGTELFIDSWAFRGNSIETVIFGPNVTSVATCFNGVTTIKTVVFLADSVDCSSSDLFKGSSGITFYHKGLTTNTTFSQATQINISEGSYKAYGACGIKVDLTPVEGEKVTLNLVSHNYEAVVDQTVCPAGSLTVYTCAGCKDSYNEKTDDYIGAHNFDRTNGAKVVDVVFANNNYFETGVIIVKCANCTQETNDEETVEALFSAGGYSLPEDGTTNVISHTIKVNKSAITKYEELTGKAINYGTVAAVGNALGNPLSVVNDEIKVAAQALASDMSGTNYTKLVIKIAGVPNNTAVNCNAYVIIDSNITYVCGMEVSTKAKEVQLNIAE